MGAQKAEWHVPGVVPSVPGVYCVAFEDGQHEFVQVYERDPITGDETHSWKRMFGRFLGMPRRDDQHFRLSDVICAEPGASICGPFYEVIFTWNTTYGGYTVASPQFPGFFE